MHSKNGAKYMTNLCEGVKVRARIVERSESGEPRSGGVSGASIGKSVPETPGSILEQAEPRFDE